MRDSRHLRTDSSPRKAAEMSRSIRAGAIAGTLTLCTLCPAGAEETRSSIIMIGANPFASAQPTNPDILAAYGYNPLKNITNIFHKIGDELSDFLEDTEDSIVDTTIDMGNTVADIANFKVTIAGKIQGPLLDGFKGVIDHRPEWMVDPPWWVNEFSRMYLGVSMDVINTGVTLGVAANSGDFAWNNTTKALVLTTVLHEGLVRAKPGVKFVAASVMPEPTLAILIDSTVEYGFDRIEDMANDRISQAFKPGQPAAETATALATSGEPIAIEYQSGAVLSSVTIANDITFGGTTDGSLTVVAPLSGSLKPSYFVAVGGSPVILKSGTVLVGNIVIQTAANAASISPAIKSRAAEIANAALDGHEWMDNTIPTIISASGGG